MKKKPSPKERKDTLDELERAVSLLERLKGTSPELDQLHARGVAILRSYKASDEAVAAARRTYSLATKKLDQGVRELLAKYGRKNLEAVLAHLVQTGDAERAEMLGALLAHGKKLSKKDRAEKDRNKKKGDE